MKKKVKNSIERLSRRKSIFEQYESVEDWAVYESKEHLKDIQHFQTLKIEILRKYWSKDIHIAPTALEFILFWALKYEQKENILNYVDERIEKSHLNKSAVVIFPLHSFGFQYAGLIKFFAKKTVAYQQDNFKVIAQTNSFEESRDQVLNYLKEVNFKNRKSLDADLFRHFYQSRSLRWFKNNPLLLLNFKFSQFDKYDNLKFIIEKLNFTTNKLFFLSVLTNKNTSKYGQWYSTRSINNWESLNIKHFLTITPNRGGSTMNCLPMHNYNSMVFDKMYMNIDLFLSNTALKHWEKEAIKSIDKLYSGFLMFRIKKSKKYLKYNRISNSINYFRNSIKAVRKEEAIINLNIAFETLLLDKMEYKKAENMIKRIWKILKGSIKKSTNLKNVESAIYERNNIIHNGEPYSGDVDIDDVNRTYCKLVLELSNQIDAIDSRENKYISKFFSNL